MFRKLQDEEIVGLNVKKSWFENSPIRLGPITDEFKSDLNIVKCLNYPNSDDPKCRDFHTNSMDMFGFVQICSQNREDTNEEENESIVFPSLISNEESEKKKDSLLKIHCTLPRNNGLDWICRWSTGN